CITPRIQRLVEEMNPHFRKKSVVLFNGVEHETFCPRENFEIPDIKQEPVTLICTGLVSYSKGTPTLYRVFTQLSTKYPNLKLRIVGGGPQLEELRGASLRDHLENRVQFDGFVPPGQMPAIYRQAQIFLQPTEGLEGFSYSILEALSTGLPVIASTACNVEGLFRANDCGLIFQAGNAEQLAEKIEFLLANPERGVVLGQNARNLVLRRFTLEGMVKNVEGIYERLLTNQRIGLRIKI
ncbi:MAG TPA: glycosyltransferase family 4 protein, partial [Candidatus Lokiarchaeia archaeon]|nr:glycosyltransferase family 4 protein [Candidatus Lokiarchaeia archaeon]